MTKLDEKPFTFDATQEVAKITSVDGEVPQGYYEQLSAEAAAAITCEDKRITDVYFNIMRRCYKSLGILVLYVLGSILAFYLTVFKCLPCRITYHLCKCMCKSCQKQRSKER